MDIKLALNHFWLWRKNNIWGWVESIVLTLLVLVFCYYVNPTNPLFVRESFSWPWLASIIIVFQYGFGPGLLSIAIISGIAIHYKEIGVLSIMDFQNYLLSGTTFILICALFSSSWARRMINAESLQLYTQERLKSLSRSYYMLRISSDYLEQNIITKPMTLRIALEQLQKLNYDQDSVLSRNVGYSFLQIVAQFCSINSVGIYLYKDNAFMQEPLVEIGNMGTLIADDPLVKHCLELRELCFASVDQIEDASDCNYLIAMPLLAANNEYIGVLVVKEMPFWSLNEEIIRILSILVYYFTNEVVVDPAIAKLMKVYPDCSADFAKQLVRLLPLKREMDIDSAVVAVQVDKSLRQHNIIYNLKNQHRLLDSFWDFETKDHDVLVTLMPFTDGAGIHGYVTRLNDYVRNDLGLNIDKQQVRTRSLQLYGNDPFLFLSDFLKFIEDKDLVR